MFHFAELPFPSGRFRREYCCYPAATLPRGNRDDVEKGGKVIMPSSALEALNRINVPFPMLFKIHNVAQKRVSHCGVFEFVAEEGRIYLPSWMMKNVRLEHGASVTVQNIVLPVATYSKFQPVSSTFLDISDPRAVLERGLRGYACLTTGDTVAVEYDSKIYELIVLETKPAHAVSVIECDMQVDFAAPIDYKEPERPVKNPQINEPILIDADLVPGMPTFIPFQGEGQRVGGIKKKNLDKPAEPIPNSLSKRIDVSTLLQRGVPNYQWKPGKLTYRRTANPLSESGTGLSKSAADSKETPVFKGKGFTLQSDKETPQ